MIPNRMASDEPMEHAGSGSKFSVRPWVLIVAVALLGAIVFLPAIAGGWIYDDHPLVADNPFVHSFGHWTRWFTSDFWNVNDEIVRFGNRMLYWRPLVSASYALDWKIGGGSPLMFHLTNSLWQAVTAALSFVVLRRWIGHIWPAFVAALLFVVHPTKAESVAWIAGRTDVLCLAALLIATIGIGRRLRGERYGVVLEVAGTLLAYLCKEQAIVIPVFVAVEVWVAAARPAVDAKLIKKVLRAAWPQLVIGIAYLLVRAKTLPISASIPSSAPPPVPHFLAVLDSLGRFFELAVFPHNLSIQHGLVHSVSRALVHSTPHIVIGAIGMFALVIAMIVTRRRAPFVCVGIALFLLTLAPTSNVVYTQMATLVSERFLYVPMLGLALVVGGCLARARGRQAKVAYAAAAVAICALSAQSLVRASQYGDENRFWRRELALHPDSREAHQYLVGRAVKDKHYYAALDTLLKMKESYDRFDLMTSNVLEIAVQVAELSIRVIADRDTASLEAVDEFCTKLLSASEGEPHLHLRFLEVGLSTRTGAYAHEIEMRRFRLLAVRADIQSRLGNDVEALSLSEKAVAECKYCISVVTERALVLARAGQYDEALDVLVDARGKVPEERLDLTREHVEKAVTLHANAGSGSPSQLQARASELAALELWGRAFDVLAPYSDKIKTAPNFAIGFAELAFRAGETGVARDVLSLYMSSDEIESKLSDWTRVMGWTL